MGLPGLPLCSLFQFFGQCFPKSCTPLASGMIKIVHESDILLVVHKASGIGFHSEGDNPGLVRLLRSQVPMEDIYPVHRLDKVTSGLMVFGRGKKVARELAEIIQKGALEKYYLALSARKPKKKQGMIRGDMTRSRRGSWKLLPTWNHPAVTQFMSRSLEKNLRLFLLKPITGRTHQLRVAMKSLGSPILGDPLYHGSKDNGFFLEEPDRTYLHAFALRFELRGVLHTFQELPQTGQLFLRRSFLEGASFFDAPWHLKWPTPSRPRPV